MLIDLQKHIAILLALLPQPGSSRNPFAQHWALEEFGFHCNHGMHSDCKVRAVQHHATVRSQLSDTGFAAEPSEQQCRSWY